MGDVMGKFMDPLRRVFSLPKNAEGVEDVFFDAYVAVLSRYDDEVLAAGALRVIETHKTRVFPLPAECVEACSIAKDARDAPDLTKPAHDRYEEWSDERVKRADRLIQHEIGQQALKEGWLLSLWDFCREQGRRPGRFEAQDIARQHHARVASTEEFIAEQKAKGNRIVHDVSKLFVMRDQRQKRLAGLVSRLVEEVGGIAK